MDVTRLLLIKQEVHPGLSSYTTKTQLYFIHSLSAFLLSFLLQSVPILLLYFMFFPTCASKSTQNKHLLFM